MIVYRLKKFKKDSLLGDTTHAIDFAASLIIESGSLYLIPAIAHFVVWWTPNDFAINVISDIVRCFIISLLTDIDELIHTLQNIPILAIAFNLIIIRLAKHRDREHGNTYKSEDIDETRSSELVA